MNKLEDLVPPLELCRKIPSGKFDDSALVWWGHHVYMRSHGDAVTPAPTLAEIMKELPKYDEEERGLACVPDFGFNEDGEMVYGDAWLVGYCKSKSGKDANPAAAAMKLWLELKGEGEK